MDITVKAFSGWENVPTPWTQATCKRFMEWCHIDKLFPFWRHKIHRKHNMANLHYCNDPNFVQRCIEVHKFLYRNEDVETSKLPQFIAEMVYAEVRLEKEVDWSSLKKGPTFTLPTGPHIPRAPLADDPFLGQGPKKPIVEGPSDEAYVWTDESSSADEKSTWTRQASTAPHDAGLEGMVHVECRSTAQKGKNVEEISTVVEGSSPVINEAVEDCAMALQMKMIRLRDEVEKCNVELQKKKEAIERLQKERAKGPIRVVEDMKVAKAEIGYQVHTIDALEEFFWRLGGNVEGSSSSYNNSTGDWTRGNLIAKCQEEKIKLEEIMAEEQSLTSRLKDLREKKIEDALDRAVHLETIDAQVGPQNLGALKNQYLEAKAATDKLVINVKESQSSINFAKNYRVYHERTRLNPCETGLCGILPTKEACEPIRLPRGPRR